MGFSCHVINLFGYLLQGYWMSALVFLSAPSRSSVGTPVPGPPPPSATGTPAGQPTAITRLHMQLHLHDLQHNASDLRNQLQQLKKLQVS